MRMPGRTSCHLTLDHEPGAGRPWMEARLLARAGFQVTVVTSGVHYLTGEEANRSGLVAGAVFLV